MKLAYGQDWVSLDISHLNIDRTLELKTKQMQKPSIRQAVMKSDLMDLLNLKKPETVAIIVEDQTRKNPEYPEIIGAVIETLAKQNPLLTPLDLFLVIAYGTHQKHEDHVNNSLYGVNNIEKVTLIHHDCFAEDLVTFKDGDTSIRINRHVAESDFVITIGSIKPHAFAGFTGGRKAILPGVASYEDIRENHSKVLMNHVEMGELVRNPIHLDMTAKADLVQVDFTVQMIKDANGDLVDYVCGQQKEAFEVGTELSRQLCGIEVKRTYDMAIVSVGGLPKDKSLYQSQRAISTAVRAVKDHGLVFVIAQLNDGIGNAHYETWLPKPLEQLLSLSAEDIQIGVHSAYLMAKNFSLCGDIYLFSSMDETWCQRHHFKRLSSLAEIHSICVERLGGDYTGVLIPNGSDIMII